jgi:uncharacterized protein (TIGR02996 family)
MHTSLFADLPDYELRRLLRAAHAEPDADDPRLVLAYWLDDHDDVRGRMIRGSLGRLPGWAPGWEGEILAFWLGTRYPRGVRWDQIDRGLIRVSVDALCETPGELDDDAEAFLTAAAQGWVGTAQVDGSVADVLRLPGRLRSVVLAADDLDLFYRGAADDDLLEGASRLPNLRSVGWEAIDGDACDITDRGLDQLHGLPRLRSLEIEGWFSAATLARLAERLPRIEAGPRNLADNGA